MTERATPCRSHAILRRGSTGALPVCHTVGATMPVAEKSIGGHQVRLSVVVRAR